MEDLDSLAMRAANDPEFLETFIRQNEFFILKCASSVYHRYITKSDDEWSVALSAFVQAVRDYSGDKGHFKSFGELVIKRKLIDYMRAQSKHNSEISVNPAVFNCDSDEDEEEIEMRAAVSKKISVQEDDSLKLEIETVGRIFVNYGFSFFELTDCSPKAGKTRKTCAQAVALMVRNPEWIDKMRKSKQLPIKEIENAGNIPRKILERHRKYIIAATEIITGDYPFLAEYLQFIREELKK